MASQISDVKAIVQRAAEQCGFDVCGIAPAADLPELQHFSAWIAAGRAGEMAYMSSRDERGELKRASLSRAAPWARSVVVCAINYNTGHPYSTQMQDPNRGWISRYAWSREDYHDAVLRRLKRVEEVLQNDLWSGGRPRPSDLTTRCYADTGPIVERVFAKYAGVGWIGKNTCIINQKKGSWLFLGVILTSLELEPDLPAPDRCGTCTRCIAACPTDAIIAPYQLDSNKCISYLTIEKRGSIPEDLRAGMGRHIFGCDICQDVCPWNRKAPVSTAPEFEPRPGFVNPALAWLAEMSADEFRAVFRGSPVRRAKRTGLRRNAAIAMGNSGNPEFLPLLEKLADDEEQSVAESARWARARLLERDEAG
ncbi:4Fe-4S ferredoxin, iron-sulfur binding protein [Candidatus Sulfotelmatobacter kueseliae]|uniref:4Fe-4S ferredoxin, iron-sulfur binding protein n=1 Tax=Candidatus Sulfotelmatobacter kueseliae TaxID=2042962 RepID=A0A2U3KLT0_9BACT|nr:4Fe-4S ferredoxin, iron-sulfur binding protein [Candidatus Sulfotelmatobacter kueseliae]